MLKFIKNLFIKKPQYSLTEREQLAMFGTWLSPTGPKLILEKQVVGIMACKECKGFGTHGNPLCGALYVCKKCNGSGSK